MPILVSVEIIKPPFLRKQGCKIAALNKIIEYFFPQSYSSEYLVSQILLKHCLFLIVLFKNNSIEVLLIYTKKRTYLMRI